MEDNMEIEAINPLDKESNSEEVGSQNSQEPSQHSQPPPFQADEDGNICPVCLEAWTNCGDHRICSLKCGHLFGYTCIIRWMDLHQSKKSCPTCKKSAKRSDLRFIYANKLIAVDHVELETMKQELENAVMQKNAALQSISKYITREQVLQSEIEQLRRRVQELTLGQKPTDSRLTLQSPLNRVRLYMEKNVEICNKSGCRDCRVFDVSVPGDYILVASRSPSDLFGAFGFRKLSLASYKAISFTPLHKNPIRDMALNVEGNKVMTVSTDKRVKITDIQNAQTVFNVHLDSAPWSCSWSPRNPDEVFVGTQNGTVNIFDVRNTSSPVCSLNIPGDFSPVVSLAGVHEPEKNDIILVAKLNSVWAFESNSDGSYGRHLLPLEGPFLSLKYNPGMRQVLVSSRPNSQINFARHTVCYLEKKCDPDVVTCNVVHTFKGGNSVKLLAKTSCFVPNNMVAGYHETRKSILLYSINTGEEVGSCPTHENLVLDMKGLQTSNGRFLAYLNERKMEFFKFNGA